MMARRLREYMRLMRIEYLGFSCVALIGGLSVKGASLDLSEFVALFLVNMLALAWSYVHNDYCDIEIDRLSDKTSGRPLVSGTVSKGEAAALQAAVLLGLLAVSLAFVRGVWPLFFLAATIAFAALYNVFSKSVAGSDVLFALSGASLTLFGALSVSDRAQGLHAISGLTWVVTAMIFVDHMSFNISGSYRDLEIDRHAHATTLPIFLGVRGDDGMRITKSFAAIVLGLKAATVILAFLPFLILGMPYYLWQLALLAVGSLRVISLTIRSLRIDTYDRMKIGRYSIRQEMACKGLVPFMLVYHIGLPWILFFLVAPPIWFLLCNFALNGKFLSLPKTF
jgi:4-hydroxybenzoate polyprenyltransferase